MFQPHKLQLIPASQSSDFRAYTYMTEMTQVIQLGRLSKPQLHTLPSTADCEPVVRSGTLTYAEDVEAETLCHRFTDQLVREAVESNMAAQTEVTFFFILEENKQRKRI